MSDIPSWADLRGVDNNEVRHRRWRERAVHQFGMLALVAAVIQHTRILQRLEAPDYAYNAMRPMTVTGCDHAAFDRRIRPRWDSSMTALLEHQRALAGS
jgi:hypothetical protein